MIRSFKELREKASYKGEADVRANAVPLCQGEGEPATHGEALHDHNFAAERIVHAFAQKLRQRVCQGIELVRVMKEELRHRGGQEGAGV